MEERKLQEGEECSEDWTLSVILALYPHLVCIFTPQKREGSMGMTHLVQSTFGCVLMRALALIVTLHLLVQHEFPE